MQQGLATSTLPRSVLVLLALLIGGWSTSHAQLNQQYGEARFATSPYPRDFEQALERTPDMANGGYIMAGGSRTPGIMGAPSQKYLYVHKIDNNYQTEWSKFYWWAGGPIGPNIDSGQVNDIKPIDADADGQKDDGYVMTGFVQRNANSDHDIFIARIDVAGAIIWSRFYESKKLTGANKKYDDEGWGIIQASDGNIVVVGGSSGDTVVCDYFNQIPSKCYGVISKTRGDLFILKMSLAGAWIWDKTLMNLPAPWTVPAPQDHFRRTWGYGVAETDDLGYVVTGVSYEGYTFLNDPNDPSQCPCLHPTNDTKGKTILSKFTSAGTHVWTQLLPDPGALPLGFGDRGFDVINIPGSGFLVTGFTDRAGSNLDLYAVRTDINGMTGPLVPGTWSKVVATPALDFGNDIVASTGGFLIGGGSASGGRGYDHLVTKLTNTGVLTMAKLRGGTGDESVAGIHVNAAGQIVFGGTTTSTTNADEDMDINVTEDIGDCPSCNEILPQFSAADANTVSITFMPQFDHLMPIIENLLFSEGDMYTTEVCNPLYVTCTDFSYTTFQSALSNASMNSWAKEGWPLNAANGFISTGSGTRTWDVNGQRGTNGVLMYVAKTNSNGLVTWMNRISLNPNIANYDEYLPAQTYGYSVRQLAGAAEAFVVAGDIQYSALNQPTSVRDSNMLLVKLTSNGGLTWQKSFGLRTDDDLSHDAARSVWELSDGFAVAGFSNSRFTGIGTGMLGNNVYVVRTDANGNCTPAATNRWGYVYGMNGNDAGECIRKTADGGLIVAGYSDSYRTAGDDDILIVKLASNGSISWSRTYGTADTVERAFWIHETSDNGFIVAGFRAISGDTVAYLQKITSTGNLEWTRTYDAIGSVRDIAYSVTETAQGDYVLAGQTWVQGRGTQGLAIRVDKCGKLLWTNATPIPVWNPPLVVDFGNGASADDHFESIALSGTSGYFASGKTQTFSFGLGSFWGVRMRCDGDECRKGTTPVTTRFTAVAAQSAPLDRNDAAIQSDPDLFVESDGGAYVPCRNAGDEEPSGGGEPEISGLGR